MCTHAPFHPVVSSTPPHVPLECTPVRHRCTDKAESRPILDQTGNLVLRQCKAEIPSAALLSPGPDYNVRNLGSSLEDWQSPTT